LCDKLDKPSSSRYASLITGVLRLHAVDWRFVNCNRKIERIQNFPMPIAIVLKRVIIIYVPPARRANDNRGDRVWRHNSVHTPRVTSDCDHTKIYGELQNCRNTFRIPTFHEIIIYSECKKYSYRENIF